MSGVIKVLSSANTLDIRPCARKVILSPEECGLLIPQFPVLDPEKLQRLSSAGSRYSRFGRVETAKLVLSCQPIIIGRDGYIVNGKHRSVVSVRHGVCLEAYVVDTTNDIRYNLPSRTYGETGLDGCIDALVDKERYESYCHGEGVYNILDLMKKHQIPVRVEHS